MKHSLLIVCIVFWNSLNAQTYVDQQTFEKAKIKILKTETIQSPRKNNVAVLQFSFVDFADNKIKFYEADIDKHGFVSVKNDKFLPSSLGAISVMTVPFKVRAKNSNGVNTAKADIKNIGLYFPVALWDRKRYWIDNTTTTHKFSLGLLIAPMAEELSDKNTGNYFQNTNTSYTAFMLSTSIAATYTYKNITFAIIPIGFDFGLDKAGSYWENHRRFWTGFGIGVDTKLFGF